MIDVLTLSMMMYSKFTLQATPSGEASQILILTLFIVFNREQLLIESPATGCLLGYLPRIPMLNPGLFHISPA